jgi:hypothetical protein
MSQISPPIRILLVAVIGLCAAYFLFLRPKEEAVPAATPAAATTPVPAKDPNAQTQSKPGGAVQKAVKGADNASARADEAAGGAVAETEGGAAPGSSAGVNTSPATAAPATGQTAAPGAPVTNAVLKALPKDVRGAVKHHKVLVMLFYNNRSYDDRAVRRELSQVDRYGKQVFVDAHWIKSVGRYQAITGGVNVDQSPTVVVVDRNLKAQTLVGYVDHETINQLVVDALRASGGSLIKNSYYRRIEGICASGNAQIKALSTPTAAAAVPAFLGGAQGIVSDMETKARAIKPAKKYRAFNKAFVGYAADTGSLLALQSIHLKKHPADGIASVKKLDKQGKKLDKQFVAKHGAHGLSCF